MQQVSAGGRSKSTSASPIEVGGSGHVCRSCGSPLSREVLSLGAQPVSNALPLPDAIASGETFFPLNVMICDACQLAQLVDCPPADVHFHSGYVYFSSFSKSWVEHAQRYAQAMIGRFGLKPGERVIEIASNDGYLLKHFAAAGFEVAGIEPSGSVATAAVAAGIPTEVRFFGEALGREIASRGTPPPVLIAANNVLAHVPNLNDFVAGFPHIMSERTVLTIEAHYFRDLIEKTEFDSFYHEHYSYFTLAAAQQLFQRHGLRVFDAERIPTHGGSLRLYICTDPSDHAPAQRLAELESSERAFFAAHSDVDVMADFQARVFDLSGALRDFLLQSRREGRRVVGFGAPAKASTLLNMAGIRRGLLAYTVDNNPAKQGRLLPGVHIPILAPRVLELDRPDVVLILPWNLRDEIATQYDTIRSWGGRFAVPVPRLEIF
jgi:hypothetical protein